MISAELKIMTHGIILTYNEHLLEGMQTGSKNEVVIRVAKNSKEFSIDPASKLTFAENLREKKIYKYSRR